MRIIPSDEFDDAQQTAAGILHAVAVSQPFDDDAVCRPVVIGDVPVAGPGSEVRRGPDGRYVSIGTPSSHHVVDIAAHVIPPALADDVVAAGFGVAAQIAVVDTSGDHGTEQQTVCKVLPARLARQIDGTGEGVVGVYLSFRDGPDAFVIAPADDPTRSVAAVDVDEVGWIAPDVVPAITARLLGMTPGPTSPGALGVGSWLDAGQLIVGGWLARLARAVDRHGPGSDQAARVLSRPPAQRTVETATPAKVHTAAQDGRLPTGWDADTLRWAGADLTLMLLQSEYRSVDEQLTQLADAAPDLAAEAAAVLDRHGWRS